MPISEWVAVAALVGSIVTFGLQLLVLGRWTKAREASEATLKGQLESLDRDLQRGLSDLRIDLQKHENKDDQTYARKDIITLQLEHISAGLNNVGQQLNTFSVRLAAMEIRGGRRGDAQNPLGDQA